MRKGRGVRCTGDGNGEIGEVDGEWRRDHGDFVDRVEVGGSVRYRGARGR